jgi:hypothetical protein
MDYRNHQAFIAKDGCTSCQCLDGTITCDSSTCPRLADSCAYGGSIIATGKTIPAFDGCNTCYCTTGQLRCSAATCN